MAHPLHVAFVWHMHQPYYRNLRTGAISLPWVRLHAAKDYLHMAEVLAAHPHMAATINLVPSLIEQILAWARGEARDELAALAEQEDWSLHDKQIILNLTFSVSWDKVIRRRPRYAELLARRAEALADPERFSPADYRDLLAWFNLSWIDPNWLERDATLAGLVAKGRGYTRDDLIAIHAKQQEIAAQVLPAYRRLVERGQLEIAISPYYHPILPLLADTAIARRPSPGLPLPDQHLAAPEDAAAQLRLAVETYQQHFGAAPKGLWPSEGAVSPEILPLVRAAGFLWLASDEAILGRSLGRPFERDSRNLIAQPRSLYRPYRIMAGAELGPYMVFRDHELSDRVGFLYQHRPGEQAAEDLICRLLEIRNRIADPENPYLVSIILDGENCWEHYEHNGDIFLHRLYASIGTRPEFRPVTISEYLTEIDPRPAATLAKLATGSWIGGDLTTWIGDPEHNRAWDALARARRYLVSHPMLPDDPAAARARQALYAAEGSDWFWWYSHRNRSDQDAIFDQLFRDNLACIYESLGARPPADLAHPFNRPPTPPTDPLTAGFCTPSLTAAAYADDAWTPAAMLQPANASTGTMQRADTPFERLLIGHDDRNLYLRLELRMRLDAYDATIQSCGIAERPSAMANSRWAGPGHPLPLPRRRSRPVESGGTGDRRPSREGLRSRCAITSAGVDRGRRGGRRRGASARRAGCGADAGTLGRRQ